MTLELRQGEVVDKSTGKTALDCFDNLKPQTIKAKATLVLIKGKKKAELVILPRQARKLFLTKYYKNNILRQLFEKRLELLLK